MFIVSKSRNAIVNFEYITSIYIAHDNCSVKVDYVNKSGCQLGRYNSEEEAVIAMKMIEESIGIGKGQVFFMPDDLSVKARITLDEKKWHHATGKKTKGHGGS